MHDGKATIYKESVKTKNEFAQKSRETLYELSSFHWGYLHGCQFNQIKYIYVIYCHFEIYSFYTLKFYINF